MADREDRYRYVIAALLVAILLLLAGLVFLLLTEGDEAPEAAPLTAIPSATSAPTAAAPTSAAITAVPPSTTLPTTAAPTTTPTTAPTTTGAPPNPSTTAELTTTSAPTTTIRFAGDTEWKNCGRQDPPADRVESIRFSQWEGFTRLVFDFVGGIPACSVGYADPTSLAVIVFPIDLNDPYAAGIFDGSDNLEVGTVSVIRVGAGGSGGGSEEWQFDIALTDTRPFDVFTLTDPSRLTIDIGD